jgi:hypothetical protein
MLVISYNVDGSVSLYAFPCSIMDKTGPEQSIFCSRSAQKYNKEKSMLDFVINFYVNIFAMRTAGYHMNHEIIINGDL